MKMLADNLRIAWASKRALTWIRKRLIAQVRIGRRENGKPAAVDQAGWAAPSASDAF